MELSILHQDEHLLVVDKPHFLPTTPGGTYIQESALVRLRNQLDLPDLIPMHRLDRMTAGVLLFSTNPETRGKYQVLFEKRQVQKEYECVSAAQPAPGHPAVDFPVVVRNRMTKSRSYLLAEVIDGEPNAETRIEQLETFDGGTPGRAPLARYRLEPHTGKTHQLRVHMASLGLGIVNDAFYPDLLDKAPDDYAKPLQLLARGIRFVDPITGQARGIPQQPRTQRNGPPAVRGRRRKTSGILRPDPGSPAAKVRYLVAMDFGSADSWGAAIYFWIIPVVLGDAIFPPIPSEMVVITGGALSADGRANFFLIARPRRRGVLGGRHGGVPAVPPAPQPRPGPLEMGPEGPPGHPRGPRESRPVLHLRHHHRRQVHPGRQAGHLRRGRHRQCFGPRASACARAWARCCGRAGWWAWATSRARPRKLPFWASSLIGVALGLVIGAVVGIIVTRRRGDRSPVEEPGPPGLSRAGAVRPAAQTGPRRGCAAARSSAPVSATRSTASRIMAADSSACWFSPLYSVALHQEAQVQLRDAAGDLQLVRFHVVAGSQRLHGGVHHGLRRRCPAGAR